MVFDTKKELQIPFPVHVHVLQSTRPTIPGTPKNTSTWHHKTGFSLNGGRPSQRPLSPHATVRGICVTIAVVKLWHNFPFSFCFWQSHWNISSLSLSLSNSLLSLSPFRQQIPMVICSEPFFPPWRREQEQSKWAGNESHLYLPGKSKTRRNSRVFTSPTGFFCVILCPFYGDLFVGREKCKRSKRAKREVLVPNKRIRSPSKGCSKRFRRTYINHPLETFQNKHCGYNCKRNPTHRIFAQNKMILMDLVNVACRWEWWLHSD